MLTAPIGQGAEVFIWIVCILIAFGVALMNVDLNNLAKKNGLLGAILDRKEDSRKDDEEEKS